MQAAQKTFISSTNWTDRIGPSAALATLKKYQRESVDQYIVEYGNKIKNIWLAASNSCGIDITVSGLPTLASFGFTRPDQIALNTRFTIEMLMGGFLAFRQFKASFAHNDEDLSLYADAVNKTFADLASDPDSVKLLTPPHHIGFQRLTKE